MDPGVEDRYHTPTGRIEHEYNIKETIGSGAQETALDKRLTRELHDNEDRVIHDGDSLPPLDTTGGLGSSQNVYAPGGAPSAWYASWWASGMPVHSIWNSLTHSSSVRGLKDGTDKLIDSGINVNGWEPGRSAAQVKQDERDGTAVPAGFWNADLSPAAVPDTGIHYPCGSPLRKRPCPPDLKGTNSSDHQLPGGLPHNELWVDPMPTDIILADYKNRIKVEAGPAPAGNSSNATAS